MDWKQVLPFTADQHSHADEDIHQDHFFFRRSSFRIIEFANFSAWQHPAFHFPSSVKGMQEPPKRGLTTPHQGKSLVVALSSTSCTWNMYCNLALNQTGFHFSVIYQANLRSHTSEAHVTHWLKFYGQQSLKSSNWHRTEAEGTRQETIQNQ